MGAHERGAVVVELGMKGGSSIESGGINIKMGKWLPPLSLYWPAIAALITGSLKTQVDGLCDQSEG